MLTLSSLSSFFLNLLQNRLKLQELQRKALKGVMAENELSVLEEKLYLTIFHRMTTPKARWTNSRGTR